MRKTLAIFDDCSLVVLSPTLVAARFAQPKHLLSDADWNGGWVPNSPAVANHRMQANAFRSEDGRQRYCQNLLAKNGLPPRTTLQLTAARVAEAGCQQNHDCGVRITVMVSAGLRSNTVWAGDPAAYEETAERKFAALPAGTINATVFIAARLADPVFAHIFTVVAEAKADTLRSEQIQSRYSDHIATGTGTDNTTVVADPNADRVFTTASTHARLGSMIAQATRAALLSAIRKERARA